MEDKSLLGFWLNVVFIHTPLGVEYRDDYQINCLITNNWSYTTNAWDYWTLNVVYITLGVVWKAPMPEVTLSEVKDMVTIIGVVIGAASLAFTAVNTRATLRTNRARFWLDLRERFAKHDEVHRQLRPGGHWTNGKGPETAEDWARLEAYMGLFEHCEVMLDQGLIDELTFREIYAYRLRNIVANDIIRREKLQRLASGWVRFLALLKRVDIELAA